MSHSHTWLSSLGIREIPFVHSMCFLQIHRQKPSHRRKQWAINVLASVNILDHILLLATIRTIDIHHRCNVTSKRRSGIAAKVQHQWTISWKSVDILVQSLGMAVNVVNGHIGSHFANFGTCRCGGTGKRPTNGMKAITSSHGHFDKTNIKDGL